jgi:integrase
MDLPTLGKQHRPTLTPEQVEQIVARAKPREAALYALLAGSGLRIGEALAIRLDGTEDQSHFSPDCRTLYLRSNMWGNQERSRLKTLSSERDVDLCPEVAAFLKAYIGQRKSGLLFCADSGKPLFQRNILRDSLHPIEVGREAFQSYRTVGGKKVKHILFPAIPGVTGKQIGFHAFRRFRVTHLRTSAMVPDAYVQFWVGHGKKTITEEYTIIKEETAKRKELAEKAGLGFKLPKKLTSMKGGKAA